MLTNQCSFNENILEEYEIRRLTGIKELVLSHVRSTSKSVMEYGKVINVTEMHTIKQENHQILYFVNEGETLRNNFARYAELACFETFKLFQ